MASDKWPIWARLAIIFIPAALFWAGVIFLLLAGCASNPMVAPYADDLPPAKYLRMEPRVPVKPVLLAANQIRSACEKRLGAIRYAFKACAVLYSDRCEIFITEQDYDNTNGWLWKHEKYGHCNGLVHNDYGIGWFLTQESPAP